MAGKCLALVTLVALAGWGAQGVQIHASQAHQALAELGVQASAASQLMGEYSPEERKLLHEKAFEKEFTVSLNMTAARERDMYIGVELDTDTDFTPISVTRIRKSGLLELWNKEHPGAAVLVGDQITKVNDILWHHNSKTFADRIKHQYKAYKGGKEGTTDEFSLFIQRPRKAGNEGRTQEQRDDLYRQQYPKDFTVDIPFVRKHSMGWQLNSTVDWTPPTIASLSSTGMVSLWNQDHPDFMLYPGDEIIMCNGVQWHHNTKVFLNHIETMVRRTVKEANPRIAVSLHIQRPKSVVEVLESRSIDKMFDVTLPYTNGSTDIGWSLQMNTSDPINITDIRSDSFLSSWNEANPSQRLAIGDRILKANSANWHHDKANFGETLHSLLRTRHGTTLRVQRKAEFKYAKGWTVAIPARVGQRLGLRTNACDDEVPVSIKEIKPLSAVSIFNEDMPDEALMPGDHIFKVNDFLWRNNSREFAQRLESQFSKSRRAGVMRLWVQRPEGLEKGDEEEEHDSAHAYLEYSVELHVTSPNVFDMGWHLNATDEGPVFVSELAANTIADEKESSVETWNRNNVLKDIQVGDQIWQVDNNIWHNNTENFAKRFKQQVAEASSPAGKGSVLVLLRRPYAAVPRVRGDEPLQGAAPPQVEGGVRASAPSQGAAGAQDDGDDVMGAED